MYSDVSIDGYQTPQPACNHINIDQGDSRE